MTPSSDEGQPPPRSDGNGKDPHTGAWITEIRRGLTGLKALLPPGRPADTLGVRLLAAWFGNTTVLIIAIFAWLGYETVLGDFWDNVSSFWYGPWSVLCVFLIFTLVTVMFFCPKKPGTDSTTYILYGARIGFAIFILGVIVSKIEDLVT